MSKQQEIFALNVSKLIQYVFDKGYTCTLGEVLRTKEQAKWYAEQGIGSTTSLHCERMAIDIMLFKNGFWLTQTKDYKWLGDYWLTLHPMNRWGGVEGDGNHFSMSTNGKNW